MNLPESIVSLLTPRDIATAQPVAREAFLSPLPQQQIDNENSQMLLRLLGGLGRGGTGIGAGLRKLLEREDQVRKAVRTAPINPNPVRFEDLMPSGVQMQAPINFRNFPLLNRGKLFQQ